MQRIGHRPRFAYRHEPLNRHANEYSRHANTRRLKR
jgi:hypothetical protein